MSLAYSLTIVLAVILTIGLCGYATYASLMMSTFTGRWITVAFLLWMFTLVSPVTDALTGTTALLLLGGPITFLLGMMMFGFLYIFRRRQRR